MNAPRDENGNPPHKGMESPKLLAQAFEQLNSGIAIFDESLCLQFFNNRISRIFGLKDNDFYLAQSIADFAKILFTHVSSASDIEILKSQLSRGEDVEHHIIGLTPLHIKACQLSEGGYSIFVNPLSSNDDTVPSNENIFQTYLEASPVGAILVTISGDIIYKNTRFMEIFEFGSNVAGHTSALQLYANPKDRELVVETILSKEGASTFKLVGRKHSGQHFPILLTSRIVTIEEQDFIFSWINDLSDMSAAEQMIEQLSEQNHLILNAAGAGIMGLDQDCNITFTNPAAQSLLGYNHLELQNTSLKKVMADGAAVSFDEGQKTYRAEREMVRKDGKKIPVNFTLSELESAHSNHSKVVVFDDISTQRAAEEVLKQAMQEMIESSRSKSQFLTTMSHELRTPLNAILGFAQILENNREQNLTRNQLNFITHITQSGETLLQLIDEAIDIATIESGKLVLSPQTICLKETLESCIEKVQDKALLREIKIHTSNSQNDEFSVVADPSRLQQILNQLLTNAIKYNKVGGQIVVSCEEKKRDIRITIADTGRGIPKDLNFDIFAPFNRLVEHEEGIEGTGLGLTICKHLCVLMGGRIGYETEEDVGSQFWIELPKAEKGAPIIPVSP